MSGLLNRKQFSNEMSGRTVFTNKLKEKGKLVFCIHPGSPIGKRVRVRYERAVEIEREGKMSQEIWGVYRHVRGKKGEENQDICFNFVDWLKEQDDIGVDDAVLRMKSGNKVSEYCKGELLGLDGYSWKKNMLKPQIDYPVGIVDVDVPGEVVVQAFGYLAGKALVKCYNGEIEDYGEKKGDPWVNPYPFKATYDKEEPAQQRYAMKAFSDEKPSDEVLASFEKDPPDINVLVDEDQEDLSNGTSKELLRAMCIVPCPLFDVVEEKEESVKREKKKKQKAVEEEPVEEEPAGFDGTVKSCIQGDSYVYEGDLLIFKEFLDGSGKGLFIDEDGDKVKLKGGKRVSLPDEESSDEEVDTSDFVKVEDCKKGEIYYDGGGNSLRFKRFNSAKGKAVFYDSEDEPILIPAGETVFESKPDEDPLEPIEDVENDTEASDTPDSKEVEMMECADDDCGREIPADSTKCPYCGVMFAPDDPEDGKPPFGDED
ncbi:MAG: hypothetical protein KAS32_19920 [Candidatus Peribacteraceae bacterium]|nr:hypothetical protein [Candidatus Peribacteraceae bacterium]